MSVVKWSLHFGVSSGMEFALWCQQWDGLCTLVSAVGWALHFGVSSVKEFTIRDHDHVVKYPSGGHQVSVVSLPGIQTPL